MQKKIICMVLLLSVTVSMLPTIAFGAPPSPNDIVGTLACPKVNAHEGQACRFSRPPKKHGFQVWPGRIQIEAIAGAPDTYLVKGTDHEDGMFDHTIPRAKDDHISFQCIIKKGGEYYGPINFNIIRGGVWRTYGKGIVVAASTASGTAAAIFTGGGGGAVGFAAGGAASEVLGKSISDKFGNKSWQQHATTVANDICKALADKIQ